MNKNKSFYNKFLNKQIVITFLIVLLAGSLFAEKTELSMLLWSRYTLAKDSEADDLSENGFALKRGYLTIKQTFTEKISGRFTTDICSSDEDDDAAGAGLKVKYAYLDFADLIPFGKNNLQFGLIKNYFGGSPDYKGIIVDPAFVVQERIVPSVDYGVLFTGSKSIFKYTLQVMNSEGYKFSGTNVDTKPAFIGDLRINPAKSITIGTSYLSKNEFDALSILSDLKFWKIDARIEFVQKMIDSESESGFSITPALSLNKIQLTSRYDSWEKDHSRIVAGVNWDIHKQGKNLVQLQMNLEREFDETNDTHKDYLYLQFVWMFAKVLDF